MRFEDETNSMENKNDQQLIDADGCAYVTRDCVCAWTFFGKWDTQISVQRHTQSECADLNYVAVHTNCRTVCT